MTDRTELAGRLILEDRVVGGRLVVVDERIAAIDIDEGVAGGPLLAPGFVDVHVHGWGGHDAMGGPAALDGMARALARRGVTSFLPTAVSASLGRLEEFADDVRAWTPGAPRDGAAALGFNLEGPFLAPGRTGAHDPSYLRDPVGVGAGDVEPLIDGLRLITIAPERPGAIDLIADLRRRGVRVSLGHSAATVEQARAGYAAGASSTTHVLNAMSGLDHRAPGLAAAALLEEAVYIELIADGLHVDAVLWPLLTRLKPADRLLLVSDALSLAGTAARQATIGGLEVEVADGRATLAGTTTLAGSLIGLDDAVRNLVAAGNSLPATVAAASSNPATMLGCDDRGRLAVGRRADIVALDDGLRVRGVMLGGRWLDSPAA